MSKKYESVEQSTPRKGERLPDSGLVSVSISKDLHSRIQRRLNKSEFASVDNYIEYVLQQILVELETEDNKAKLQTDSNTFSKEDQESVEQRLRNLGYI